MVLEKPGPEVLAELPYLDTQKEAPGKKGNMARIWTNESEDSCILGKLLQERSRRKETDHGDKWF